jgi:hypothetical protein
MKVTRFPKYDEHGMPNTFRCDCCRKDFYFEPSYVILQGNIDYEEFCDPCFKARFPNMRHDAYGRMTLKGEIV